MKIKGTLFRAILMVVILTVTSCKKDKNSDVVEGDEKIDLNQTDSRSQVEFSDKKVQDIYAAYLDIKAALVNSNSDVVKDESKKLYSILDASEENKQLKATSKLISLTKDIKKQRDFFVTITDEVGKLVSVSKITSGDVFKQYCPMAFDGAGGYWLSDSKEIRNPYYGSQMLKCGSVKEVFK